MVVDEIFSMIQNVLLFFPKFPYHPMSAVGSMSSSLVKTTSTGHFVGLSTLS